MTQLIVKRRPHCPAGLRGFVATCSPHALLDARPRSPTHRDDDDDDDARFQCKFSRGGGGGHVARAALLTTERVNVRRATVAVSVGGGSVR